MSDIEFIRYLNGIAGPDLGHQRPDLVLYNLLHLSTQFPDPQPGDSRRYRLLTRALSALPVLKGRLGATEGFLTLEVMLLSKAGRHLEALTLARSEYERAATWDSAVRLANALRRAGDLDAAIETFHVAARHDPPDLTAYIEVGDICLTAQRWSEAIRHYELVIDRIPEHPWALPSLLFCLARIGDSSALTRLRAMADAIDVPCDTPPLVNALLGSGSSHAGAARAKQLLSDLTTSP